jgi:hypothetical protein
MAEPSKRDALVLAAVLKWSAKRDELAAAKTEEAELRVAALTLAFPSRLPLGTTNLTLCDGSVLKAVVRPNVYVDQATVTGAIAKLKKLSGAVGVLLGKRLVKWTAEASIAEFKKLTEEQRNLFKGVIELKPGSTSLELQAAA